MEVLALAGKLLLGLKLLIQPRALGTLALACGIFLVMPLKAMTILGLDDARSEIRPWAGGLLTISAAGLITHFTSWAKTWTTAWVSRRRIHRSRERRMSLLSSEEKRILAGYLQDDSRSQYLPWEHGAVSALVSAGILSPARVPGSSVIPIGGGPNSYIINDWAWEHLHAHGDILGGIESLPRRGSFDLFEGKLVRGN